MSVPRHAALNSAVISLNVGSMAVISWLGHACPLALQFPHRYGQWLKLAVFHKIEIKSKKTTFFTSYLTMLTILYYSLASLIGEQDFKPVWVVFLKGDVYNWNSLFFFYNSLVMFSASSGSRRAISAIAPASFAFGISSTVL